MVVSAIDNLVKGAAGQAVQNMNLMLGFPETARRCCEIAGQARRHAARRSGRSRDGLAAQIASARARGVEIVVVHGGGKQMTRYLAERGIESRFVNGLRVTTPETVDAVLKVFAGSVNHELVAALNRAGASAVGLTGIDAPAGGGRADGSGARRGRPRNPIESRAARFADGRPAISRWSRASPASRQGEVFNVNADQMAVACATAFRAEELIFLTDVDGVLDGDKEVSARSLPRRQRNR